MNPRLLVPLLAFLLCNGCVVVPYYAYDEPAYYSFTGPYAPYRAPGYAYGPPYAYAVPAWPAYTYWPSFSFSYWSGDSRRHGGHHHSPRYGYRHHR